MIVGVGPDNSQAVDSNKLEMGKDPGANPNPNPFHGELSQDRLPVQLTYKKPTGSGFIQLGEIGGLLPCPAYGL